MFLLIIFVLFAAFGGVAVQSADQHQHVRQCSCAEQDSCIKYIRADLAECFLTCWDQLKIGQFSPKPAVMKQCMVNESRLLDQTIACINKTAKTCWIDKQGPQISKVPLQTIFLAGEKRLMAQAHSLESTVGEKFKQAIQPAIRLAICWQECFMHKSGGQQCFDRNACMPKLDEDMVYPVLKRCALRIGWKRYSSKLCDCFLQKADVSYAKPFCQLLRG